MTYRWAAGLTTVPQRITALLPGTLSSLQCAGFPPPRLFVDGCADCVTCGKYREMGLDLTVRTTALRPYGNWVLALAELLIRDPEAHYYAMFQDDFVCYQNLREYLEQCRYPQRGYWNLYTFPQNQVICPDKKRVGWYASNQRGLGAVALVFSRDAVFALLAQDHMIQRPASADVNRRYRAVDGAIVTAMKNAGWAEYVHNPSLVQHLGRLSTISKVKHPDSPSFKGECFDAMKLLGMPRLPE